MNYKKDGNIYFVKLEKGEEIISKIKEFAIKEQISSACVTGIGAINSVTLGYFKPDTKEYSNQTFEGYREITSLMGNITKKDEKPYLHFHLTASGANYTVIGGHLESATISATGEIIIKKTNAKITRKFSEEIGLNLLEF